MFTGLIEDVGRVGAIELSEDGARIAISTPLADRIGVGDSVAVNGACLTATAITGEGFEIEAMNQTLGMTTLGTLEVGSAVNLELALEAGGRLGGHLVQGHVDGVGAVEAVVEDGFSRRIRFSVPEGTDRYLIPQGSITLQGVSLTLAACGQRGEGWAEVALIPETLERTNLGGLESGDPVNLECDVIARYVERMLSPYEGKG